MVIDLNRLNGSGINPTIRGVASQSARSLPERVDQEEQQGVPTPPMVEESSQGVAVQLSSQAQQLQSAAEKMAESPAMNQERIAQLQQLIAAGDYAVDADRIAQKMLSFESQS